MGGGSSEVLRVGCTRPVFLGKSVRRGTRSLLRKRQTLDILADPEFDVPGAEDAVESRWDELTVVVEDEVSAVVDSPADVRSAATSRSRTFTQNWKIAGITYTSVSTTVGWTASGSTVLSINRYYGSYVNFVPLRSISSASWSSRAVTSATCKTEWTLGRPLQSAVKGAQGLKVNAVGTLLQTWKV